MAIRFFSNPVRVLSIGRNPIQVSLIRSDPIRSGPVRGWGGGGGGFGGNDFRRQGGVKTRKPSVLGMDIIWNCPF